MSQESESREIDRLKYSGNSVPLFIKIVWVWILLFVVYYFVRFGVPDLQEWMKK